MKKQKRLKVGIVVYGDPNQISGGYLYDRMLARRLRESGHHAVFLSLAGGAYTTRPLSGALASLTRQVRVDGPFDFIIVDELCHPSLALGMGRLRRALPRDTKIVVLVHHLRKNERISALARPWISYLEKRLIAGADALVVNSNSTIEEVSNLGISDLPSVIAAPSGKRFGNEPTLSPAVGADTGDAAPGLRVLFVGNIIPRKGLHTLIEAVALAAGASESGENIRILVTAVGSAEVDTRYTRHVKNLAAKLGISDYLSFTGSVDDDTLEEIYARHDLFCVPSQFEGFGIVYLEAMGFGLPAIGSSDGGAVDIIRNDDNGFLVAPGDVETLSGHLSKIRDNRDTLERLSAGAVATYIASPSWDESMSKIETFLENL